MFILLDTTAILSDPLCAGTAWRVVAHAAAAWNLRVFVPEVVVAEAIAGYRRRIHEAQVGFQRWADKHAGPLGLRSVHEAAQAELEEAVSSYPARLRETLNALNVTVIEPPEVAHMVLVERAAARRPPCNADGDGYRDTLNWLSLLALASEYRDERIVWVSNNSEDFGSDDNEVALHQDLVAELAAINAEDRVQWIRTLPDVVLALAAEHSPEAPADLAAIQARLREQALSQFISTEILTSAVERPVDPRECGLPTATRSAKIITVGEPNNLDANVRGAVGDSEAVVAFALEAETSIEIDLPPDSSSDDPRFSVVSADMAGSTGLLSKPLRFSGLITLDRYDRPQGGELTRVTARRDDPGLLVWKQLAKPRWPTGLERPVLSPEVLRGFQEWAQVSKRLQEQMQEQAQVFKGIQQWAQVFKGIQEQAQVFRRLQESVTQPDRPDDAPAPDNGEEESTSGNSQSKNLSEANENDEPTDA
jgi:PIN domain